MTTETLNAAKARILIVEDHPLVCRGLTSLIESETNLIVCGVADTCQSALNAFLKTPSPNLVIVDLKLGEEDGHVLISMIKARHPEIPVLVLSSHDEFIYAECCLKAGARGYVSKRCLDTMLLTAINCVLDGKIWLSEQLKALLAERCLRGQIHESSLPSNLLSSRELQVFELIGYGQTTRQIAEKIKLSIKTIESHRESIKRKLGIKFSAKLAQRATQWVESDKIR